MWQEYYLSEYYHISCPPIKCVLHTLVYWLLLVYCGQHGSTGGLECRGL